jgi:hypothetical protein
MERFLSEETFMVRPGCEARLQLWQTWVKLCNLLASSCLSHSAYASKVPLALFLFAHPAIYLIAIGVCAAQGRCRATVVLW